MGDYLVHYGIKGQSWGKRRFQNLDGSLTPAGERRYNYEQGETGSERRHGGTSGSFNNSRYRYESRNRANAANARVFPQINQQLREQSRSNAMNRASNYGTQSRFGSRNQQRINEMRSQNRNAPGSDGANSYHMMSPDERDRLGQQRVAERSRARRAALANNQKAQEDGRNRTDAIKLQRRRATERAWNSVAEDQARGRARTEQMKRTVNKDQADGERRTSQINDNIRINRNRAGDPEYRDYVPDVLSNTPATQKYVESQNQLKEKANKMASVKKLSSTPAYSKGQKLVAQLLSIFKRSGSR